MSFYTSISGLLEAELFAAGVRAMGVGLPYAIANATFGGTAEYVALWPKSHGVESSFFWYVSAMSVVLLVCSLSLPHAAEGSRLDGERFGRITDAEAGLAKQEVDAALLYGVERSTDIQTTPLVEDALWVIGPPESGLQPNRPVTLLQLSRHRVVLPSAPHGIRTLVDHACAVANVTLDLSAETNDLNVQKGLVLGGHGVTLLPAIAVADDLRHRRLTGAPLARPGISRTIMLAQPVRRQTARHVRCATGLFVQVTRHAIDAGAWPEGRWLGP